MLFREEEVVGPGDGVAEGLLAAGEIAGAGSQELETAGETGSEGLGREDLDTGGGELNGEGETVEAGADLGDGGGVGLGQGEGWIGRADAGEEEGNRRGRGQFVRRCAALRGRDGERGERELLLAGEAEGAAAGGEDSELGAGFEEQTEIGGGADDVFQVVDRQQGPAALKGGGDALRRWAVVLGDDAEGAGDGGENEVLVGDGSEGDEDVVVREGQGIVQGRCHGEGEPCLADAARSGDGDEAMTGQKQTGNSVDLGLPADE